MGTLYWPMLLGAGGFLALLAAGGALLARHRGRVARTWERDLRCSGGTSWHLRVDGHVLPHHPTPGGGRVLPLKRAPGDRRLG